MGFNNLRMLDVSTLKVVHHRTQLLSQSKHFWSLLSNKSCCCTPNNRDEIVAITSCRKKELFKTLIHINLKCRHSILCLVYFSFHLKFVNKSTSKNHESVLSKFMQFIAQRSLFCVFPSRAVKPLRPLLLHRQDAVAVTIVCFLKFEKMSVLKCGKNTPRQMPSEMEVAPFELLTLLSSLPTITLFKQHNTTV